VAAADRHGEAATGGDGFASIRGYGGGSRTGNRIGIVEYFQLHEAFSRSCVSGFMVDMARFERARL
jgi:hypothetical protein